jgi:thiosulfate/3-mercaptopyruvate sulfurtransferase
MLVVVTVTYILLINLFHQWMIRVGVSSAYHCSRRLIPPRFVTTTHHRFLSPATPMSDVELDADDDRTTRSSLLGKVQIPIETAIQCHGQPNVVFIDGSWWLGQRETTNVQDFESGPRIWGAHCLDIDDVCSPPGSATNPKCLPHMMPTSTTFAATMDAMGIRNTDHIIVYGQKGCPFVYRAYFQLGCMGHDYARVHLLAGSLHDWILAGGKIDAAAAGAIRIAQLDLAKPTTYRAVNPRNVVSMNEILDLPFVKDQSHSNDTGTSTLLVDVRSPDRFYGRVDEPRPGLRLGHIPGAKNLFFFNLLDTEEPTKLKPRHELLNTLKETLGPDVLSYNQIIATCGSGATACVLAAALMECGMDPSKVYIYDGSWCEWGDDSNTPIVKDE